MPLDTMLTLLDLAKRGALVLFQNKLPTDVPGLGGLEGRRNLFHEAIAEIGTETTISTETNRSSLSETVRYW